MDKNKRQKVFEKYDGRCAFCGYDLGKGWQSWDIDPIKMVIDDNGSLATIGNEVENLLPACKSCASTRNYHSHNSKMDIEQFRKELADSFDCLKNASMSVAAYRKAIRYNLIVETRNPIVFYFEKVGMVK